MSQASQILRLAKKIVIFSGAGISAESGIPTFREKLPGPWSSYDARELETSRAFRASPELVWGWYLWRRHLVKKAQPNSAHVMVAALGDTERQVTVVTQNIDDLHERAGSRDVLHLHGDLETPKCSSCKRVTLLPQGLTHADAGYQVLEPPRCLHCNGRLRPDIVWFNEPLPKDIWKLAMSKIKTCDVLVSIGTSGLVTPAADIPEAALAKGAIVIHVNKVDVSLGGQSEIMLMGSAASVLRELLNWINPHKI